MTMNAEDWKMIGVVAAVVFGNLLTIYQTYLKDRRERKSDEQTFIVQKDIADNIRDVRNGQIAQNGKLSTVVEVNRAYHDELMRMLKPPSAIQPQVTNIQIQPDTKPT
jgi:hypothetical protein